MVYFFNKKEAVLITANLMNGGEMGIRTPGGTKCLNSFQDCRFRPLSHLSVMVDPVDPDTTTSRL